MVTLFYRSVNHFANTMKEGQLWFSRKIKLNLRTQKRTYKMKKENLNKY